MVEMAISRRFRLRELVVLPACVAIYATVIHWVYASFVTQPFAYLGYRYEAPVIQITAITWFVAYLGIWALPRRLDRPSAVVLWILFTVVVAPTVLMAPYTSYLNDGMSLLLAIVVGLVFMVVTLGTRGKIRPFRLHMSSTSFWSVLLVFSVLTYALLAITQGLSLRYVSLSEVYDVRAEFSDASSSVGLLSYLVFTQANVVNPIMIARGVYTRRLLPICLGVVGQLVLFSGTGFKDILFSILAMAVLVWVFRRDRAPGGLVFVWGATALMVFGPVVDTFFDSSSVITSLFSRRFLLTPGVFSSAYVAFFSDHPQAHLGYSVLRWWVNYPYTATPPHVMGDWMAGLPKMAANANLFADGFANFGWLGIVGAGAVLLVYLRILDRAAYGLPTAAAALVVTMPAVALANASVLTSMFTHGLVVAVVLLAFAPRDGWRNTEQGIVRESLRYGVIDAG